MKWLLSMIFTSEAFVFIFLYILAKPVWDVISYSYGLTLSILLINLPLAIASFSICEKYRKTP